MYTLHRDKMPELDYVKLVKKVAPVVDNRLMIWFLFKDNSGPQHKRDQEKDESFIKTINSLSDKAELQAKLFWKE